MVSTTCQPAQSGSANGANTVGGALGGQLAAALLVTNTDPATGMPTGSGFAATFSVAAVVAVAGAALASLPIVGRRTR